MSGGREGEKRGGVYERGKRKKRKWGEKKKEKEQIREGRKSGNEMR